MTIELPNCLILESDVFKSKKGTTCGALRWLDAGTNTVCRTMVFGDDTEMLTHLGKGSVATLTFDLRASRRDDTLSVYLVAVGA